MAVTKHALVLMFLRGRYGIRGLMAKYGLTRLYVEDAIREHPPVAERSRSMNEVLAAEQRKSELNGQQYVNLCNFLRQHYEYAMVRATKMTIRITDVEIGEMIMYMERYIRQCDKEKATKKRPAERSR